MSTPLPAALLTLPLVPLLPVLELFLRWCSALGASPSPSDLMGTTTVACTRRRRTTMATTAAPTMKNTARDTPATILALDPELPEGSGMAGWSEAWLAAPVPVDPRATVLGVGEGVREALVTTTTMGVVVPSDLMVTTYLRSRVGWRAGNRD
jgi:hypothetical protein